MVRWIAARGKLALAFWMPFAFCGLARCEGAVEVHGAIDLGAVHQSGSAADLHSLIADLRNRNGAGSSDGNAGDVAYGSGNRALNFGPSFRL
jgi:hypothetical protein